MRQLNTHQRKHQNYLQTKKTTTDYFSINAYYWDLVIKRNFSNFSYLEIGSWEGNSALYILENFQTKRVVEEHEKERKRRPCTCYNKVVGERVHTYMTCTHT